jgi:predicted RNase H-like HicB family nuclease
MPRYSYIIRGEKMVKMREFDIVIEKDDGCYIASVPALPGCHTQAKSLDKLMERIKDAIELYLEVKGAEESPVKFAGIQRIAVPV